MEMIYYRLTVGVIRLFNCCAKKGFSVLFNKLGNGESLQEAEPLMFVDHPVDMLSCFIKFFSSALFARLFFNALEEENLNVV